MRKTNNQGPVIQVRLGSLHEAWCLLAQGCGKTPSGLLHDAAAERLAAFNRGSPIARTLTGKLDPRPRRLGTTLSMSASEELLMNRLLEKSGLSLPSLIVMLVRLYGLQRPFLSKEELERINQLKSAMIGAGLCMNDMPKRLEKAGAGKEREEMARVLHEKADSVLRAADEASDLIRALRNRFRLDLARGGWQ